MQPCLYFLQCYRGIRPQFFPGTLAAPPIDAAREYLEREAQRLGRRAAGTLYRLDEYDDGRPADQVKIQHLYARAPRQGVLS